MAQRCVLYIYIYTYVFIYVFPYTNMYTHIFCIYKCIYNVYIYIYIYVSGYMYHIYVYDPRMTTISPVLLISTPGYLKAKLKLLI